LPNKKSDKDYHILVNILTDIWFKKLKLKRKPAVTTSWKEWKRKHECWADDDVWGQQCDNCNMMYIDVSHHDTVRIQDTVVHELLHYKYPDMDDGPKFQRLVEKTLKGKK
jgi:hypothetical protein